MPLTSAQLTHALRERAARIHEVITLSYATKTLGVSEESITEFSLVELDHRLAPHVLTRKFTRREEHSQSGADWLWTIGRPGRWFSVLVQAKLARPNTRRLQGLHHGRGQQLTRLLAYARAQRCLPLYVVYNNRPANLTRHNCGVLREDPRQMGSVIVRTRHVANLLRRTRNTTSIPDLLAESVPWACLFGCLTATSLNSELADVAAASLACISLPPLMGRHFSPAAPFPTENPSPRREGTAAREKRPVTREKKTEDREYDQELPGLGIPHARHVEEARTPFEWPANLPDDHAEAPSALITEHPPEIVQALLRGVTPVTSPVGLVSILSSEPLPSGKHVR